jgi:hypothetical protein
MILSALIYMAYTNRFLELDQGRFIRAALVPGLWPYLTGFALYLLASPWIDAVGDDRWGSVLLVLIAGVAYCALQAAVLWLFQLDAGEKDYVADKFRGLAGRFGRARRQR